MIREYFELSRLITTRNIMRDSRLDTSTLDIEIIECIDDYCSAPITVGRGRPYNDVEKYRISIMTIDDTELIKNISNKKKAIEYASLTSRGLLHDDLIVKYVHVTDSDSGRSVYLQTMSKSYTADYLRCLKEDAKDMSTAHD